MEDAYMKKHLRWQRIKAAIVIVVVIVAVCSAMYGLWTGVSWFANAITEAEYGQEASLETYETMREWSEKHPMVAEAVQTAMSDDDAIDMREFYEIRKIRNQAEKDIIKGDLR